MKNRPELGTTLTANEFKSYYYLKEELVQFCRECGLTVSGSKLELTERILTFLDSGIKTKPKQSKPTQKNIPDSLSLDTEIEPNIRCSEVHRAFFKLHLGTTFSFNVPFQKWLKQNAGKTYAMACQAYREIQTNKKNHQTIIEPQFEYNTYIRDFFDDNKGKALADAIQCWKHKKSQPGHNKYHRSDLTVLDAKTSAE